MKKQTSIDGQLSLWDMTFTEKPEKVTKAEINVTEIPVFDAKKVNSVTDQQEKVIEKYRLECGSLTRIIGYCGGGLGIEYKEDGKFITKYINGEGECEFTKDHSIPLLPMDKILVNNLGEIPMNKIQTDIVNRIVFQPRDNVKRVIKRKGDYNVIVEYDCKIQSIRPDGRQLDFYRVQAVYSKDEVFMDMCKSQSQPSPEEIQGSVKLGDFVQALFHDRVIEGEIVNVYGLNDAILNIVFDNGTKHTAIGRMAVKRIIKSA